MLALLEQLVWFLSISSQSFLIKKDLLYLTNQSIMFYQSGYQDILVIANG